MARPRNEDQLVMFTFACNDLVGRAYAERVYDLNESTAKTSDEIAYRVPIPGFIERQLLPETFNRPF